MSWLQRYKLRNYVRNSIWLPSVLAMVAALVSINGLDWVEQRAGWQAGFNPSAALAMFGTLAGSLLTFIVFLSSTLVLVLQIAGGQLSPRIIGLVFRYSVTRFSLTLFTFTFTFTLAFVLRIDSGVPALTGYAAGLLCMISLGAFLFLIEHVGRMLRPSGILLAVARLGHEVIRSVYPRSLSGLQKTARGPVRGPEGEPSGRVSSPRDGVLLAFDLAGLVAMARETDCVVELVPQVGDFVAAGSPLFRIFGSKGMPSAKALCQSVALGQERTVEQDPAFTFRIIVDIASKALSPAINDPTTAVLAIDQIHHLLRSVGGRHLDEGLAYDKTGSLRLVYQTPNWEDFVCLAVTEIRQFGGLSIQVVRRLLAMLENLVETLPPERAPLLIGELERVHRSVERSFTEPEDQFRANVGDLQGIGGKHADHESPARDGHFSSSGDG
jgi:uncharacterized membrane protein